MKVYVLKAIGSRMRVSVLHVKEVPRAREGESVHVGGFKATSHRDPGLAAKYLERKRVGRRERKIQS